MGLGFEVSANRRQSRFLGLSSTLIDLEEIERILREHVAGTPLAAEASWEYLHDGRTLAFTFHPAGEPLFLEIDGDSIIASAKTSSVGPGYHVFLVECLDHLQEAVGLRWQWEVTDDDETCGGDETGYAEHRDFSGLRKDMISHFKSLYRVVVREGLGPGCQIDMPVDGQIEASYDVLTPLGPLASEDMRSALELSDGELEEAAGRHFPWWSAGFDGQFYRGIALCTLWTRIRWAAPLDEGEAQYLRRVLNWCDKAAELGARPPLPADAVKALRDILSGTHAPVFADPDGVGYRRHCVRRFVAPNWQLSVPGCLEMEIQNDGHGLVMWNNVMTIRATAFSTAPQGNGTSAEHEPAGVSREVEFFEPEDEDCYCLQVVARTTASSGSVEDCVLTFWMAEPDRRAKAEEIAATIAFKDPDRQSSGTLH